MCANAKTSRRVVTIRGISTTTICDWSVWLEKVCVESVGGRRGVSKLNGGDQAAGAPLQGTTV